MSDTIVLATKNRGKIKEMAALLEGRGIAVVGLSDFPEIGDIPETGTTFAENSHIKALAVAKATGMVAVADDSGLEVDALSGAPGVYSARYAGEAATDAANNEKLLAALAGVPEDKRAARFKCVMTACAPGGETIAAEGVWEGRIAYSLQGENGFGYDPLFFDPQSGSTSACLSREEKNARSHRGKALLALLAKLPEFLDKTRG